jgi:hypothetical protein
VGGRVEKGIAAEPGAILAVGLRRSEPAWNKKITSMKTKKEEKLQQLKRGKDYVVPFLS